MERDGITHAATKANVASPVMIMKTDSPGAVDANIQHEKGSRAINYIPDRPAALTSPMFHDAKIMDKRFM